MHILNRCHIFAVANKVKDMAKTGIEKVFGNRWVQLGALVAGGLALMRTWKTKKSVSGIGYASVPSSILNKAKKLFDAYDRAVEIEREHDAKCDAIYENFREQGIDPFADENERVVIDALYKAGLTDKNGLTDVYVNRHNAHKELLDYVNANIVSLFPISAGDRKLLSSTRSIVYQNRILDVTRDFVNKTLEHNRNIREIMRSGVVGEVLESDFWGADVATTDGQHMVRFSINGDQIGVAAFYSTSEGDRDYMGEWEFWSQIGWYSTLAGAKRAAKKWMAKMGYELSDMDLNKI